MRKFLLVTLVFLSTGLSFSQAPSGIHELLSRLEGNHMGSIDEVFTKAEQVQLRAYLQKNQVQESVAFHNGGQEIFAPENNATGDFGHFNTSTPENFNAIAPSEATAFDGAGVYNPFTGTIFAIDNDGNAYEIIPLTGMYIPIGTVNAPAGESITGVELDPVSEEFYVISTDGAGNCTLSIVDWSDLSLNPVGNPALVVPIALGFDGAGAAYTYDIDDDILYQLNVANGSATAVGPIGFNADFGQGMFYSPTTDNLCMVAFNGTTLQSELRMVDTSTGATTLVGLPGSVTPGGITQFGWASAWDNTLSVNDLATGDFTFYPNPARDALQLKAELPISRIQIYNLQGRLLIDLALGQPQGQIDISGLSSGSYILNVQLGDQTDSHLFIKE